MFKCGLRDKHWCSVHCILINFLNEKSPEACLVIWQPEIWDPVSGLFMQPILSFFFFFQKLFNWSSCGRNGKKSYQQRIFKYWYPENRLEEHCVMFSSPCCKAVWNLVHPHNQKLVIQPRIKFLVCSSLFSVFGYFQSTEITWLAVGFPSNWCLLGWCSDGKWSRVPPAVPFHFSRPLSPW